MQTPIDTYAGLWCMALGFSAEPQRNHFIMTLIIENPSSAWIVKDLSRFNSLWELTRDRS